MSREYVEAEVCDSDGNSITRPQSAIEQLSNIKGYNDLVLQITKLKIKDVNDDGNNKKYDPSIARAIWQTVILSTKPMIPRTDEEKEDLISVYKVLYSFTKAGEYPLLQQLCNFLGVNIDDFFAIISTAGHPKRDVYFWAYNVFESASTMNAVRSNGNAQIRIWLDKSRENKISAESKVELSIEARKLVQLESYGKDISRELITESVDEVKK